MRVLLDNNVDRRFGKLLLGHEIVTASSVGWASLKNGELIRNAEAHAFDVIVTSDKNLRFQQNMTGRRIGLIVLNSLFVDLAGITPLAAGVIEALERPLEGKVVVISPE